MSLSLFPTAYAQDAATQAQAGAGYSSLLMLVLLFAVFYMLLIRPQAKRAKEHRELVSKLNAGDEVITSGGLAGVISEVGDSFLTLKISDSVQVQVQRHAVTTTLPKGTLKAIN